VPSLSMRYMPMRMEATTALIAFLGPRRGFAAIELGLQIAAFLFLLLLRRTEPARS
jgi:hypothetical protein